MSIEYLPVSYRSMPAPTTAHGTTRRRPTRDDVRRRLLDAAAVVFARRGIEQGSLDEVAAAAGFTKGAVYSNFDGKDGLIRALAEDNLSAYLSEGLASVADTDRPLRERVRALGDRLSAISQGQRDWQLLFLELWQRAARRPGAADPFIARRRDLHAVVTAAVAEHAEQAGVTLPLDPAEMATLLMALTHGLALERLVDPDVVPDDLLGRVLALLVPDPTHPTHPA